MSDLIGSLPGLGLKLVETSEGGEHCITDGDSYLWAYGEKNVEITRYNTNYRAVDWLVQRLAKHFCSLIWNQDDYCKLPEVHTEILDCAGVIRWIQELPVADMRLRVSHIEEFSSWQITGESWEVHVIHSPDEDRIVVTSFDNCDYRPFLALVPTHLEQLQSGNWSDRSG